MQTVAPQDAGFAADSASKQSAASAALRTAVDTFARPELERLLARHRMA